MLVFGQHGCCSTKCNVPTTVVVVIMEDLEVLEVAAEEVGVVDLEALEAVALEVAAQEAAGRVLFFIEKEKWDLENGLVVHLDGQ